MLVGKRMTRNPITIKPDTPVAEAQAIMRREKIHHLPVVDERQRLVGIVTEKDLLYASPSPATSLNVYEISYLLAKLKVEKIMTRKVITVSEEDPLEEAARIMADRNLGGLPVVREGLVVGIITESDLFRLFIELFAARKKGLRVTMVMPEKKGELARVAAAINNRNGNILAFGSVPGEDSTQVLATIKVEGIAKDELAALLKPLVLEITDVREV